MIKISSQEEFKTALKENERFWILKHSLTCPISQAAFEEYEAHDTGVSSIKHYYLAVQDARELSDWMAEEYHVKHESPQVILFNRETVAFHASHWKITKETLSKAVAELD